MVQHRTVSSQSCSSFWHEVKITRNKANTNDVFFILLKLLLAGLWELRISCDVPFDIVLLTPCFFLCSKNEVCNPQTSTNQKIIPFNCLPTWIRTRIHALPLLWKMFCTWPLSPSFLTRLFHFAYWQIYSNNYCGSCGNQTRHLSSARPFGCCLKTRLKKCHFIELCIVGARFGIRTRSNHFWWIVSDLARRIGLEPTILWPLGTVLETANHTNEPTHL